MTLQEFQQEIRRPSPLPSQERATEILHEYLRSGRLVFWPDEHLALLDFWMGMPSDATQIDAIRAIAYRMED